MPSTTFTGAGAGDLDALAFLTLSMILATSARNFASADVSYQETVEAKAFANRTQLLSQALTRIRFLVVLFASDGRQVQRDWLFRDGTGGLEIAQASDEELHGLAASAVAVSAGR